jgi:kinetochore protein Nuf2
VLAFRIDLIMSGQYWFPNMPIPEIMTALSEWGLNVSNEQLVRPSPDFVIGVYNACLEQVTSISPNVLHKPTQRALASLDDANPVRASALLICIY